MSANVWFGKRMRCARWGCTTWTGYFKCREVKTGFYRNRSMQTGSSGTLIGWKSGQTTFVPLWDRMEGAWLRTLASWCILDSGPLSIIIHRNLSDGVRFRGIAIFRLLFRNIFIFICIYCKSCKQIFCRKALATHNSANHEKFSEKITCCFIYIKNNKLLNK